MRVRFLVEFALKFGNLQLKRDEIHKELQK